MKKLLKIQDNNTLEYEKVFVAKYSIAYDKLWGSTERNLRGSLRGTLTGILPIVKFSTIPMKQHEATRLGELLNQSYFYIEYYDNLTGETLTGAFTASGVVVEMLSANNIWYKEYTMTLTAVDLMGEVS